ncbi:MAG: ABC transporter permease [Gemmatimonadota bacterium]
MSPLASAVRAALGTLREHPLRTALSTLGVVIGVASLIAILALGEGLEAYSRGQIAGTTGVQSIVFAPRTVDRLDGLLVPRDSIVRLDAADAAAIADTLAGIGVAVLDLDRSAWVSFDGDTARKATLLRGTSTGADVVYNLVLKSGRFLSPVEVLAGAPAAVVSQALLDASAEDLSAWIGRSLRIGDARLEIVGIVAAAAGPPVVWVPLPQASLLVETPSSVVPRLVVRAQRVEDVRECESRAAAWIGARHGAAAEYFEIQTMRRRVEQVEQAMGVFKLAMGSITGISILVGGIGIMNVMLSAVQERTREIGIRRAAGARRADVLIQFLAESVAVTLAGGLLGIVLGTAGAYVITAAIRRATEAPVWAQVTPATVAVGIASAVVVGLAFGTYPAMRAAHLSPIDAIRHE